MRRERLMPIHTYSLDDTLYSGEKMRIDSIGQDPETGKLSFFGRNIDAPVTGGLD